MAEKKKQNLFLSRFQTELLLVGILVALFLFFGMKSPV
ncbi:MAG: ABC transporter permease, partial [Lacrimispora celerecrescens]|nr:ABC transporter permease [Lacrimispora celerecrescens]